MARKKQKDYIHTVGRRKTAVARIRLHKGKEQHQVNGVPAGLYFPGEEQQKIWSLPFALTKTEGKYFVTVKTTGGGKRGQLTAFTHGVSRALVELNAENKPVLRKNGLLTRDPRKRQRRMVGTGGKARRAKQSPKR